MIVSVDAEKAFHILMTKKKTFTNIITEENICNLIKDIYKKLTINYTPNSEIVNAFSLRLE